MVQLIQRILNDNRFAESLPNTIQSRGRIFDKTFVGALKSCQFFAFVPF
ncbi:hypothetical protein PENVUL_c003G03733 [Penicillium vulpinum]|uniref:Uncharacterized protein n=1 Tax=Penicillium vulpinum TaxID=29845 RepID=A0A1V6SBG0_9EURO|nr:hypothetical protein PENVUL_c003G03733 [Penicillium vulpinum]